MSKTQSKMVRVVAWEVVYVPAAVPGTFREPL